ncbi:GNAT family N-acetyltransferase [Bacillus sp. A116_S68]|nr:GNAT family N-acetyltransferase [Bacillus sp. A116_S68]
MIRKLKPSELENSIRLSEFAFQYEMTEKERREHLSSLDPDVTWVMEENGVIMSKASVLPFHIYIDGKPFKMGGVAGVATWPEYRRSGLVSQLLKHALKDMKENGQSLSFLHPFSIPFYRKFGWELFSDEAKLTLSKEQLPGRLPHNGHVKRIEPDYTAIDDVYQQWAKRYSGTLVRDEKWWKDSLFKRKKGMLAAYYHGDQCTGYMIYTVKEMKMTIHELIWITPDARNGLMSFISNHDSMIETVSITTAPHERLPFLLPDPKVKHEVSSYFMARIVDVHSFLKEYPFKWDSDAGPLIFHVTDETCEWNNGTYIIKFSETKENEIEFFPFSAEKTKEGVSCQHAPKKGIHLDVRMLTAILLGSQSPQTLAEEALIESDEKTLAALITCLPPLKPFLYDFF